MKNNIIGWIVGFVFFFVVGSFVPKSTCMDGWASSSIGRSGACSHHGGVRVSPWRTVVLILSIAGGFLVTHILNEREP